MVVNSTDEVLRLQEGQERVKRRSQFPMIFADLRKRQLELSVHLPGVIKVLGDSEHALKLLQGVGTGTFRGEHQQGPDGERRQDEIVFHSFQGVNGSLNRKLAKRNSYPKHWQNLKKSSPRTDPGRNVRSPGRSPGSGVHRETRLG